MRMLRSLRKAGISYRIISLTKAKFSLNYLLDLLTEKQRETLFTAFKLGYYDIPRKASSDELAKKLGIRNPTFVAHRPEAERGLMTEIFKVR